MINSRPTRYYAQSDFGEELVYLKLFFNSVLLPIAVSNGTLSLTLDMARDLQSITADHSSGGLEAAETSWILATSVAESLLANSEPGFTQSLNYSETLQNPASLGIAVARVSPETPEEGKSTLSNPRQSVCLAIVNPGSHCISLVRARGCPPLGGTNFHELLVAVHAAETHIGLAGALQIALPTESLQNATGPVDVIILCVASRCRAGCAVRSV